jgi:hypothetical protein
MNRGDRDKTWAVVESRSRIQLCPGLYRHSDPRGLSFAFADLHAQFQIHHTTLQFETADHDCRLAPEGNV